MARSLGFDNINMDLIVGLPGEDKEKVAHTLENVEALNPDSLTVHSLALKRATRLNLFKDKYQEISFENSAEIMKMTMDSAHRMEMGPYYMYRQKNMAGECRLLPRRKSRHLQHPHYGGKTVHSGRGSRSVHEIRV